MPEFQEEEEMNSDEDDYFLDSLNDNYYGRFIIDANYNRPLKNFPLTLQKIEEVDETSIKSPQIERNSPQSQDENGNLLDTERQKSPHVAWNPHQEIIAINDLRPKQRIRPKSANCAGEDGRKKAEKLEKRPKSSCAGYPSRIPIKKKENSKKLKSDSESSSVVSVGEKNPQKDKQKGTNHKSLEGLTFLDYYGEQFVSFGHDYPSRPSSACCMRSTVDEKKFKPKRSNSQPNISRYPSPTNIFSEVSRFRRSLRLLGLSRTDFGLPESPKLERPPSRSRSSYGGGPTFTTRVLQRSYSLDCLREVVREAAKEKYHGIPQRRILAQAAYEEWYFKKSEELSKKLQEEEEKSEKVKEKIEEENRLRMEKAGENYQKWIEAKKIQQKSGKAKKTNLSTKIDSRLMKSKEEIDKAYLEWKKQKKPHLEKKKRDQLAEAEKAEREKSQKEEKKRQAEKAFKEWKLKLQETQRINKEKENKAKEKLKEQLTARSKSSTSFEVWKEHKDGQIKAKWKKNREAAKQAQDVLSMSVTERMYEAEQAFEEWLEKVENRKQKNSEKGKIPRTIVPWAPT